MVTYSQMLLVSIGGAIGALFRLLLVSAIGEYLSVSRFPVGTLSVNIVGCLAMGVVVGVTDRFVLSSDVRLFLAAGLLGGFTTFSAFGLEVITLLRAGEPMAAGVYVTASVVVGCLALVGGLWLSSPG